jgi:hypothetical protein
VTYLGKKQEEEARARLKAFWSREKTDRPALWAVARNPDFEERSWPGSEDLKTRELIPEYQVMMFENSVGRYQYLAEAMPGYMLSWGSMLVTLAVFAGGDYDYEGSTAYIKQMPDLYARSLPQFDANCPVAERLTKIYRELGSAAKGRGYLNPPVMIDAMTTLSRFRGTEQLCLDLVERPDKVKRWSSTMTEMYNAIYEHFFQLVTSLGFGDTTSWLHVMAEGRYEAVQCDFAVTLSPEMFREFVLPDLQAMTECLDFSLYHLDGVEQMRFLDLLRECPALRGIQWNPQPGVGSPLDFVDDFRQIRERDFCLYIDCSSVDQAVELSRALGPTGLFLVLPVFDSHQAVDQAICAIDRACRKRPTLSG